MSEVMDEPHITYIHQHSRNYAPHIMHSSLFAREHASLAAMSASSSGWYAASTPAAGARHWPRIFGSCSRFTITEHDLVVAAWFTVFLALNLEMNFLLKWAMKTLPNPTFQAAIDSVRRPAAATL